MHFLSLNMRNILVPALFGFAKKIRFSSFASPLQCNCIAYFSECHQDLITSLFSLMTLNYFKTSYMILTKLGAFNLVSLWHVLMFAELEIKS